MYQRIKREIKFDSPWITLFLDDVINQNKTLLKYNIVHFKDDSVVVVVRRGNQFLMTENYRYPIEEVQVEFPSGGMDEGETPEQAAQREVLEETGIRVTCAGHRYLCYPSNGITDQKIHIIIADYTSGELIPQDDEILKCYWLPKDDLIKRVKAGKITDAPTLIALFYTLLDSGAKDLPD